MGKKIRLAIPLRLGREAPSTGKLTANYGGRRNERGLPKHELNAHWFWSIMLGLYATHFQMRRLRQQNECLEPHERHPTPGTC